MKWVATEVYDDEVRRVSGEYEDDDVMPHQALTPFARKLAETMLRVEPKWRAPAKWDGTLVVEGAVGVVVDGEYLKPGKYHGWTQKDHEAILDRPRVVEP